MVEKRRTLSAISIFLFFLLIPLGHAALAEVKPLYIEPFQTVVTTPNGFELNAAINLPKECNIVYTGMRYSIICSKPDIPIKFNIPFRFQINNEARTSFVNSNNQHGRILFSSSFANGWILDAVDFQPGIPIHPGFLNHLRLSTGLQEASDFAVNHLEFQLYSADPTFYKSRAIMALIAFSICLISFIITTIRAIRKRIPYTAA